MPLPPHVCGVNVGAPSAGLPAHVQSIDLMAAGSLNLALSEVSQAFKAKTGITVTQNYSPSGRLRKEIEAGLRPDIFASADTASPEALEQDGLTGLVQVFIDPTLQIVSFPPELTVPAPFGLTVFDGASPATRKFADYILSPHGQQILASYGFTSSCRLTARNLSRDIC